jgi:hypothetical protein
MEEIVSSTCTHHLDSEERTKEFSWCMLQQQFNGGGRKMFESRAAVQQIAFPPGLGNNLQVEKFAIYDDA